MFQFPMAIECQRSQETPIVAILQNMAPMNRYRLVFMSQSHQSFFHQFDEEKDGECQLYNVMVSYMELIHFVYTHQPMPGSQEFHMLTNTQLLQPYSSIDRKQLFHLHYYWCCSSRWRMFGKFFHEIFSWAFRNLRFRDGLYNLCTCQLCKRLAFKSINSSAADDGRYM